MNRITVFKTNDEADTFIGQYLESNTSTLIRVSESGSGEGLELICAVSLNEFDGRYGFEPTGSNFCTDGNEYASIKDLVEGVRRYLGEESTRSYGATVTPFIYTVAEKITLGDDEKEGLKESRMELERLDDDGCPAEMKAEFLDAMNLLLDYANVPIRGLNLKERKRFEELFYQE